ncbi:hypothetical protein [Lysobacter sp. HA35]
MIDIPAPVATLLGVLISGLLLLHVHRKNARRSAAAKYRAALLESFAGLYPVPSNWPRDIDSHLREIFPALQRAAAEFRPYMLWRARRSYDRAWSNYRLGPGGREIDKQLYHQYMGFTDPGQPASDPKATFKTNVARLLAFAGET